MKVDFAKLSSQQKTNLESALKAYNEKKAISSFGPPVQYIELTQNCIGKCVFCKTNWINNPSYNMPDKIFNMLLKDYIPYAVLVDLRGWGESLILPNFAEYLKRVAELGPKIRLTTTLGCGSKKIMQGLIDHDVYVSVSFDFADKKLYEKIRKGINYDTVIKNMSFLTKGMRKKGTLRDNIRLAIAPLQKANLGQIEKIIRIAEDFGITEIAMSQLVSWNNDPNLLERNKRETIEALRKCVEYSEKNGIKFQLLRSPFEELYIKEKAFDRCCHPWLYVCINYKGDILFCDHMLGPDYTRYAIGNASGSLENVWNGKKAQQIRLGHVRRRMRELPDKCQVCYTRGRYADHEHQIDEQFDKWLVTEKDIEKKLFGKK